MVAIRAELKKDVKKYLSDVKKCLCCDRKTKNRFLRDLEENVNNYLSDAPNADFQNVITLRIGVVTDIQKFLFQILPPSLQKVGVRFTHPFGFLCCVSVIE